MIMKNRCNIKYILLSVALCWGGSNVSNASVLSQGLTAFEKDSSVKPLLLKTEYPKIIPLMRTRGEASSWMLNCKP